MPPPSTSHLERKGYRWEVSAGVRVEDLAPCLDAFPDIGSLPGVEVLKSNHFRTVFRVPASSLAVGLAPQGCIVKVYRYTSVWDRFRYRFLRHRAAQEEHALRRFHELELPTAVPLAAAERRRGRGGPLEGGGLIVTFLGGTGPLVEVLAEAFGASPGSGERGPPNSDLAEARDLLARTGKLIRKLHDRGVWHRDLHAGNILVARGSGALSIIDLHTCVFLPRLWRWQRRSGLAKLLHSLRKTVPLEGLRIIIEAYGVEALAGRRGAVEAERLLLRKVEGLQRRRLKSRSKRCFLPSTLFGVQRRRGMRLYHLRAWSPESLEPLWSAEAPGSVLKQSSRGWLAVVQLPRGTVCVKHRRCSLLEGVEALLESHRLRRAYGGAHALTVRGIPAPQVIALRERRVLGIVREAHFVAEWIEGAVPLDEHLFREHWGKPEAPEAASRKRLLARAAGDLLRRIHDSGLYPHDLSPQNLLVSPGKLEQALRGSPEPFLWVTDLDHLYLWKPLWERGRRENLVQLGNLPEGHVSVADRLRGLKSYARGEARYLRPSWIHALRRRLLKEHLNVLNRLARGETNRPPAGDGAP